MSADVLTSRLKGVKKIANGRWLAQCPAHDDKRPSLSVAESTDKPGVIILHCWAGCEVAAILARVGLEFSDLYPPELHFSHDEKRERLRFFPSDVFEIARTEITVASVIACDMHAQRGVSNADYERLLIACGRLSDIAEGAYGRR